MLSLEMDYNKRCSVRQGGKNMENKLLVGVEEAAAILSLGRSKAFELVAAGEIESLKVGRRRLIPVQALDTYVQRQREIQAAGAA